MEGGELEHSQFLGQDTGALGVGGEKPRRETPSLERTSRLRFCCVLFPQPPIYSIPLIQTPEKMTDIGFPLLLLTQPVC